MTAYSLSVAKATRNALCPLESPAAAPWSTGSLCGRYSRRRWSRRGFSSGAGASSSRVSGSGKSVYRAHHPRAHARSHQGQLNLLKVEQALTPGPIICAQCLSPVCKESKWYCEKHLRLTREAVARSRQRRWKKASQGETILPSVAAAG